MIEGVPTMIAAVCAAMVHLGSSKAEPGPHGPRVIFSPRRTLSTERTATLKSLGFYRARKISGRSIYVTDWGAEFPSETWVWTTPKPSPYT